MATYGKTAGSSNGYGESATNLTNLRASVYDAMTQHGWAHKWNGQIGAQEGGSVTALGAIWLLSNGNPGNRYAGTSQMNVSRVMSGSADTAAVISSNIGIVKLVSGERYALGYGALGNARHGMVVANSLPASSNKLFYMRNIGSLGSDLPSPMAYTESPTNGHLAIWIDYDPNVAPSIPGALGPSGTTLTTNPLFTGSFSDANETVNGRDNKAGEKLKQYRIQLRVAGSSTLIWDQLYSASATEQSARAFSRAYGGTGTLTPGTNYEWRCQVSDQFDAWSLWTDDGVRNWTPFVLNAGGSVTVNGTGVGKVNTRTPTGFGFTWNHLSGLGMNGYRAQIIQGDVVVRDVTFALGTPLAAGGSMVALPDTSYWTAAGWAPLDWGVAYYFRVRGRDTTGVFSEPSGPVNFNTNAMPTIPTGLTPASGTVSSNLPLLTFSASDADNTPATGLVGKVRIKNNAGTVLFTRDATNIGGSTWQYQVTSTDFASFAIYKWDAFATDGILTSGFSNEQTINYAQGPVITITDPTVNEVVTGGALDFAWTVSNQVSWYGRIYLAGSATPLKQYPTYTEVKFNGTYITSDLPNNTDYDLTITVTNQAGLTSESPRRRFRIQYPAPPTVQLVKASPEFADGDVEPTIIRITFAQSTLGSDFAGTFVSRRLANDPAKVQTPVGTYPIPSITQTAVIDQFPTSKELYIYSVFQAQRVGITTVYSLIAESEVVGVDFSGVILSDARDISRRVVLDGLDSSRINVTRPRKALPNWSGGPDHLTSTGSRNRVISNAYMLNGRGYTTPIGQLEMLEALSDDRADGTPTNCYYRSGIGFNMYGVIGDLDIEVIPINRLVVRFPFQETQG